ncbi:hypothetical protein [Hymenobacter koreensis]|uniref:Uncharacterized protein n=1 Tax=Hymenobacter koreensis TaxID=1084523 RepID=A0ABP8IYM4_9BACT
MLRFLTALFLLLFPLLAQAQSPVSVNLDSIASITFPAAPQVLDTLGQRIYSAQANEGTYMVTSRRLDNQPGFKLAQGELSDFYLGLARGATQASGGKVLRQKSFAVDGLDGLELTYTNTTNQTLPAEITSRSVYVNGYLITYQVLPTGKPGPQHPQQQAAFFSSFRLQPQLVNNARQYTLNAEGEPDQSQAGRLGYVVGQAAFYLLLAVGLFLLVRRLTQRSRKQRA